MVLSVDFTIKPGGSRLLQLYLVIATSPKLETRPAADYFGLQIILGILQSYFGYLVVSLTCLCVTFGIDTVLNLDLLPKSIRVCGPDFVVNHRPVRACGN